MYRFDTGSGPAVIRSVEQVRPDTWHEVRVTRRLRAGTLALDSSPPVAAESPGTTRGLNIQTPFYFGGLDTDQFQPAGRVGVAAPGRISTGVAVPDTGDPTRTPLALMG